MVYRLLQKFQYWMMGRNGTDQLALAALIAGLILSVVGQLFFWPLVFVSYLLYFWTLFRVFSRNLPARQRERPSEYWGALLPGGSAVSWPEETKGFSAREGAKEIQRNDRF